MISQYSTYQRLSAFWLTVKGAHRPIHHTIIHLHYNDQHPGFTSSALSFMLENLSNFYKREVEEAVTVLTKAMEPTVIFVVAAIVGTIVISLYLPMFDLINQMG